MQSRIGFASRPVSNKRRVARDFVPDQIAIHGKTVAGGGEHADFAPLAQIFFRRQPTVGDGFEFLRIEAENFSERGKICFLGALRRILQAQKARLRKFRRRLRRLAAETSLIARALRMMSPGWSSRFTDETLAKFRLTASGGLSGGGVCARVGQSDEPVPPHARQRTRAILPAARPGRCGVSPQAEIYFEVVNHRRAGRGGVFGRDNVSAEPRKPVLTICGA